LACDDPVDIGAEFVPDADRNLPAVIGDRRDGAEPVFPPERSIPVAADDAVQQRALCFADRPILAHELRKGPL
jgi:hypothetical protein